MKKLTQAAVLVAFAIVSLTACGAKANEPFKDAPRSAVDNGAPADLIRFPDGFNNVATKCDHGNRVYVIFHGDGTYGALAVVPNDPTCK